ncbi:serine/threonine-protein kinase [Nocardioides marmoraquaticus]
MSTFPRIGEDFGRFRITALLGQGGMGVVFRATQLGVGRDVALKVVPLQHSDDTGFRQRFTREAEVLASLDSPHITQIVDAGEVDGCLFLATQLVPGGDLGAVLREQGPLAPQRALLVAAQVARALEDAHGAGVLHRDVKPSNVLVRDLGGRAHVYLCDFGVARPRDSELTTTGVVFGTYGYLAPECCLGEGASAASDVYSVGCLLWAMLAGEAPYTGSNFHVARQHVDAPLPTWSDQPGAGPEGPAVDRLLGRTMAKSPADRFGSAALLARALETAAADLAPRPPTDPAPTRRRAGSQETLAVTRVDRPTPAPERTLPTARVVATAPPGGRSRLVGAAVVAALLVVAAGAWALLGPGGADEAARTRPTPSPGAAAASSSPRPVTESATAPDGAGSTTASSGTGSEQAVTCWDNSSARPGQCPVPTGEAGLRWVFPSVAESQNCRPDGVPRADKTTVLLCELPVAGGVANVTYSEYTDWAEMAAHYREVNGGRPPTTRDDLSVYPVVPWRDKPGLFRASVHHAAPFRFAVTAYGPTPRIAAEAMAEVRTRARTAFGG